MNLSIICQIPEKKKQSCYCWVGQKVRFVTEKLERTFWATQKLGSGFSSLKLKYKLWRRFGKYMSIYVCMCICMFVCVCVHDQSLCMDFIQCDFSSGIF